jgi:hypothetical protein
MTKGFNIDRFKTGTKLIRIRPANSGDRSYIGWPATLLFLDNKRFAIFSEEIPLGDKVVELELWNFKHGWVKIDDLENPKLEIPSEVIAAIKNKDYYAASSAINKANHKRDQKVFFEIQRPYKEREKYKQRHP